MFSKNNFQLTIVSLLIVFSFSIVSAFTPIYISDEGPIRCEIWDSVTETQFSIAPNQTTVNVLITDGIAQIKMIQEFTNPLNDTTELQYVFPLPENGSVHGMKYTVGSEELIAVIKEREEAIAIYDSIQDVGGNVSLLVQQKADIFQQNMANVAGGDTVYVEIILTMPLKYNNGVFELAFPTYIAPRCCDPDEPSLGYATGSDWNPEANIDGAKIDFNVAIQTGYEITGLNSPTHPIESGTILSYLTKLSEHDIIKKESDLILPFTQAIVLEPLSTYPNSDFVLRFNRKTQSAIDYSLSMWGDAENIYFMSSLYPNEDFVQEERQAIELMVLYDVSGSQSGWPLIRQAEVAVFMISQLKATDKLCVLAFESSMYYAFTNKIVDATEENKQIAIDFINAQIPSGGTNLLEGVTTITDIPTTTNYKRIYAFMTDGMVQNQEMIYDKMLNTENPQVMTFGAGNNLNRSFLEDVAEIGNGFSTILTETESSEAAAADMWNKLEDPQLSNVLVKASVEVDMEIPISSVLYSGMSYTVYGKAPRGSDDIMITISGMIGDSAVSYANEIKLSSLNEINWGVPKLWAKHRIAKLETLEGSTEINKDSIIGVSLDYQVLSKYTAFIAYNANVGDSVPIYNVTTLPGSIDLQLSIEKNINYSNLNNYVLNNFLIETKVNAITSEGLELSFSSKLINSDIKIELYTITGELVVSLFDAKLISESMDFKFPVNLSGMYIIKLSSGSMIANKAIIIK